MSTLKHIELRRGARYESNIETFGEHSNTCCVCGRPTAEKFHVHMDTWGNIWSTLDEEQIAAQGMESMGAFPIGPECAKRYPSEFIFTLTNNC